MAGRIGTGTIHRINSPRPGRSSRYYYRDPCQVEEEEVAWRSCGEDERCARASIIKRGRGGRPYLAIARFLSLLLLVLDK